MKSEFKIWQKNRDLYLDFLNVYSLEQLNTVPQGFSNNLIWNIGHIIVVQQLMVYKASNLPMYISDDLFLKYKPGTKPTTTSQTEVDELKDLLISLVDKTQDDFATEKFSSFNEFTTRTGFQVSSLKEAIDFNNYHEGLHLGFMMNIRKFI